MYRNKHIYTHIYRYLTPSKRICNDPDGISMFHPCFHEKRGKGNALEGRNRVQKTKLLGLRRAAADRWHPWGVS